VVPRGILTSYKSTDSCSYTRQNSFTAILQHMHLIRVDDVRMYVDY